jgi:lysophospholipase L1-like esterase
MPLFTPPPSYANLSLPGSWDTAWRNAKAASGSSTYWMTALGDSFTEGMVATDYLNLGWWGLLRANILARGYGLYADYWPTTNCAFFGYTNTWAGTAPWVINSGAAANQLWQLWGLTWTSTWPAAATVSDLLTFTTPYACTTLAIIYYDYAIGTFSYNVDGGAAQTITCAGSGQLKLTTAGLAGLANTAHTIHFTAQSAGNVLCVQGVQTIKTSGGPGLAFANCAVGGDQVANHVGTAGQPADRIILWQGWTASGTPTGFGFPTQPSLAIISFGLNDVGNGKPLEQYQAGLDRMVRAFQRGQGQCSVLFVIHSLGDGVSSDAGGNEATGQAWSLYCKAVYDVAALRGCGVADFSQKWGMYPSTNGLIDITKANHPTNAGHADIAALLETIL